VTDSGAVVYLVRHGRTALNARGQLRGRLDPPLDEFGARKADALGRHFVGLDLASVVSSPLSRARQTAEAIGSACGLTVILDERLIDRDYGAWAGSDADELVRRFGALDHAPGVEPLEAVTGRAVAAIVAAEQIVGSGAAVVVAHDAVNRAVLAYLIPELGDVDSIPQRTGCWNRLEQVDGSWRAPVIDARPDGVGSP
jgi:broad specificity phosphatase PhoE